MLAKIEKFEEYCNYFNYDWRNLRDMTSFLDDLDDCSEFLGGRAAKWHKVGMEVFEAALAVDPDVGTWAEVKRALEV